MLAVEEQHQRQWSVDVHAKSRSFSFKLRATTTALIPTGNSYPAHDELSLLFRLRKFFVLEVKSHSRSKSPCEHRRSPRYRFLKVLQKLRLRRSKERATSSVCACDANSSKPTVNQIASEAGILAIFLFALIFVGVIPATDLKGAAAGTSVILIFLASLLKRYVAEEASSAVGLLNLLGVEALSHLGSMVSGCGGRFIMHAIAVRDYGAEILWKICKWKRPRRVSVE